MHTLVRDTHTHARTRTRTRTHTHTHTTQPPYTLPLLISRCEGSISASGDGKHTVTVAFGRLQLHPGGMVFSFTYT